MFKKLSYFIILSWFSIASAAWADGTTATRVTITTNASIPDPEMLADSLFSGSDHNRAVRMERHNGASATTLQIDLWGTSLREADIPNLLRNRFPELTSASISTATIEAPRPAIEDGGGGGRRIIHKEIRTSP